MAASESFFTTNDVVLSNDFSERTILPSRGYSLLVKARRYGRWWMLKGLKYEYRGQTVYEAFLRKEYEILCQLQHPLVVSAFSFEQIDGVGHCIVMEWIEGTTLKQWLLKPHSLSERRQMASLLTEAVAYVHSRQTQHRDLKPSNVMVTGGYLKLIDFGLSDTQSHVILKNDAGTQGYMAPDGASDIYSLGVILREMRLGMFSRTVLNQCLLPRERRISSVTELSKRLRRSWLWPRRVVLMLSTMLIAAVLFPILLGQFRHEQQAQLHEVEATLADSLRQNKASQRQKTDSLQRRIVELEAEKQAEMQRKERQQSVVNSICRSIDNEVKTLGIENLLDTVSTKMSVGSWIVQSKERLTKLAEQQVEAQTSGFGHDEKVSIEAQLQDYIKSKYTDRWQRRYASLPLY